MTNRLFLAETDEVKREEMRDFSPTAKLEVERENLAWLKAQCSESERLTGGMVRQISLQSYLSLICCS